MNVEVTHFPYLSAILLSCVVGLLIILFIPREREALVKGVSLVFSGIALALSIYVFCAYDRGLGGLQFVLVLGVFGFFMSMDLFFLFVWYDVSLFPMYPLIAIWGTTRKEYGALKLFLYLLAGSALVLAGIVYLAVASGLQTFDIVALMRPGGLTPGQQKDRESG